MNYTPQSFLLEKLPRMTIDQLKILHEMATASQATITTGSIKNRLYPESLSKAGGVLSSLSKVKVNNAPLIQARGKTEHGLRWMLSKSVDWKEAEEILRESIATDIADDSTPNLSV